MTRTVAADFIGTPPNITCTRCGSTDLAKCCAATTVWRDGRPFLIEEIPSLRCGACGETLIKDETAVALDRICGQLPGIATEAKTVELPIICFAEAMPGTAGT